MSDPAVAPLLTGAMITSRIDQLAAISEDAARLTRVFLSPQHRSAAELLLQWMREAGMAAHVDAIGNVCGRYEGEQSGLPCLMLGSHLDTVRDAGKWDGPLGLVTALACVADLNRRGRRLPFAIELVAFADEEGTRFGSTLLGSRALAGTLSPDVLAMRDRDGRSIREAMQAFGLDPDGIGAARRNASDIVAYVELHIEQGPVLESRGQPVGVVTAINGATRLAVHLQGVAGHAGTVPMALRRDALAAAAECMVAVEALCRADQHGLVGTVGIVEARPGAANVIPGRVSFTLDIRAPEDNNRREAVADILRRIREVAQRRGLAVSIETTHDNPPAPCAPWLRQQLGAAVAAQGYDIIELPSGAGHDGMAMIDVADIGMIFVRCQGGISHNPAEHVEDADAEAGARVLLRFIENFEPPLRRVDAAREQNLP
jgi:allantoate deiminase